MTFEDSIVIRQTPEALFALTQDYGRLQWDPFLRSAALVGGAAQAGMGARAYCVAHNGLGMEGMETEYVSFNPPAVAAVKMTRGPWFIGGFTGSWRFLPEADGRTRVVFRYSVRARPGWLQPLLNPVLVRVFAREVRRRLEGLRAFSGLDSSIIAALARRFTTSLEGGATPLHSFAIGLEGAPDLLAAREVAAHMGTEHHELHFTVEEEIDALPEVIHHLETYDVTTIRAATPMYLMARRIRAMGIRMVLSGEGSDEIFGGYLYFHRAPDPRAFHEETVRKLDRLHLFDCLRANKSMAAWGVEARVPFLDREFVDVAMRIDPAAKMAGPGRMEKHLLREAFADALPASIAWRQKEQFSDGVGYGWIDSLRAHAGAQVSVGEMEGAAERFPHNPPATKEAYFYRAIFAELFPLDACAACVPGGRSVACSTPEALAWDAAFAAAADPSGRAVRGVHTSAF